MYILKKRLTLGAVILLYHRVTDVSPDPFSLAVSPDRFAQQLEYIRQTCWLMPLRDLVEAVRERSLPRRAVAITFDDGYLDNLTQAQPLLEAARIPWTLFVTSGGIDSPREFWWDELVRVLLLPKRLPKQLQIHLQDRTYEWSITTTEERHLALQNIYRLLQSNPLPTTESEKVLSELFDWARLERTRREGYRSMTTAELVQLAQSEFVDIGGHTKTHPSLAALSPQEQQIEIEGGREKLEAILGRAVNTFSYPHGDYSPETPHIVADTGFCAALTTVRSRVEHGDNPFLLGRCEVKNWDIEEFKHRLEKFFITRKVPNGRQ